MCYGAFLAIRQHGSHLSRRDLRADFLKLRDVVQRDPRAAQRGAASHLD